MKKLCSFLVMAVVMVAFGVTINAQQMQIPAAPVDSGVRVGKLANGLTYYIRHNEYPKGQVDFHIAQKVGSVQENDNQRGLAHFLEHMCFNGTKNFPEKKMITWLESNGVKFGYNLNAYTSTDRTVYMITNVPNKPNLVDSCLLILHDWADDLTLATDEINKERGVIHEEWRQGNGAFMRILEKNGNKLYQGCKYGDRLPIGIMDVVDHFDPNVLRDYYQTWYRPDLQGIVVVGDIDVDKVEAKIKELFSPIKMPANPGKFEYFSVPDNDQPIIVAQKDREMPAELFLINVKYDKLPRDNRNTDITYLNDYIEGVASRILNERLNDIAMKADAPFASAAGGFENFLVSTTKGAVTVQATIGKDGAEAALKAVLTELKRLGDYGFTASEYDRARTEYLSGLEKQYSNRNKQKNDDYAQVYISNFIDNLPMSGIDHEYNLIKTSAPMIPVEAVNQSLKQIFNGKNIVIIATGPDKADFVLPTEEALQKVAADVQASKLEPLKDNTVMQPLMSEMPKPGKIVSEKAAKFGFTELKLSNGATVMARPTTFKDDEILMTATSKGGASLYSAADYPSVAMISALWELNGVDKFTYNDLQKMMSGKQASVSLSVGGYDEGLNGRSTTKDFETMMQLLYLNIAKPRYDKEGFKGAEQMATAAFKNQVQNPNYVFSDSVSNITYQNNPKAQIMGMKILEKMNYDRMHQIVKERFANAGDFVFTFVGNFDMPTMKKFAEEYIGSLPGDAKKKEVAKNDGVARKKGVYTKEFEHKTENDQAMLAMTWFAKMPNTLENRLKASVAGQLMSTELLNSVREDEGAAYSPHARGMLRNNYDSEAIISASFALNPDKREKSTKLTIDALENLAKNVKPEELAKVKEYMLKQIEEDEHDNSYWLDAMDTYATDGLDKNTTYRSIINGLTPDSMQKFIASLIKQGNRSEIIMLPVKK